MLHSEISIPIDFLVNQNLTLGTEWNQQRMKDCCPIHRPLWAVIFGHEHRPQPVLIARFSPCLLKTTWS
jgi:outer membrane receptor for ferrienterochelin and colicin